ncbi:hypothetical protein AOQ84DRAFT_404875 [Glonium stellatum]|uniref:Ribosomal RNA-processing protein 8 n=1 Tax=Glonium stellatum TaxID=574774 RepID=A0A8E2JU19_9PEZI|nr:hypothetical protein AOQ84DRAFT_404875 [Glonium stellatum]
MSSSSGEWAAPTQPEKPSSEHLGNYFFPASTLQEHLRFRALLPNMFSVPGWNVSTALKTQTETFNSSSGPNAGPAQNGADKPAPSKKRKRGHGKSKDGGVNSIGLGPAVTNSNMVEMWERHIEGKKVEKTVKSDERAGKKRKKSKESKENKDHANEADSKEQNLKDDKPEGPSTTEPSKKKSKKDKKPKPTSTSAAPPTALTPTLPPTSITTPSAKLTPLQLSMRAKLASARFRHLNETLYTTPSAASLALFRATPEMFTEYHTGFAQQVSIWPENPVDSYVRAVLARGRIRDRDPWRERHRKGKGGKPTTGTGTGTDAGADAGAGAGPGTGTGVVKPLPRALNGSATLADLGCGTAGLALALQPHLTALRLRIHSFDLARPEGPAGPLVTIADVAALPLADASVDVAVFCLALMGTNWLDFMDEAYRILRWRGELWVAEIKSRFGRVRRGGAVGKGRVVGHSVGSQRKGGVGGKKATKKVAGDGPEGSEDEEMLAVEVDGVEVDQAKQETDVSAFVEVLRKRGFVLDGEEKSAVDLSNKMFVKMQFIKGAAPTRGKNVKAEEEGRGGGMKHKKPRFIGSIDEEEDVGDEGSVLKPCVYKQR